MISTHPRRQSPPIKMVKSIRELLGDFLALSELQVQLFRIDFRDSRRILTRAVLTLVASVILLIGSLPIALMAMGFGFAAIWQLPTWAGLGLAAAAGLVIGMMTLWIAGRRLSRALACFNRSQVELSNNLRWFKRLASVEENHRREVN